MSRYYVEAMRLGMMCGLSFEQCQENWDKAGEKTKGRRQEINSLEEAYEYKSPKKHWWNRVVSVIDSKDTP